MPGSDKFMQISCGGQPGVKPAGSALHYCPKSGPELVNGVEIYEFCERFST